MGIILNELVRKCNITRQFFMDYFFLPMAIMQRNMDCMDFVDYMDKVWVRRIVTGWEQ